MARGGKPQGGGAMDKNGTWTQVTDDKVMAPVLNSGESFYCLTARNPDVRALNNLFDRLCGSATCNNSDSRRSRALPGKGAGRRTLTAVPTMPRARQDDERVRRRHRP
jgi:hypothetical protein